MINEGQIYIKDPTQNKFVYLNSLREAVVYLEDLCQRGLKKTRKQFLEEMFSLGYNYTDDDEGIAFVRALNDHLDIGLIKGGKRVKCDITMEKFKQSEYGN